MMPLNSSLMCPSAKNIHVEQNKDTMVAYPLNFLIHVIDALLCPIVTTNLKFQFVFLTVAILFSNSLICMTIKPKIKIASNKINFKEIAENSKWILIKRIC